MTSKPDRSLHLTFCNKVATTQVKHDTYSWDELCTFFTKPPTVTENRETLAYPLFVPFKMTTQAQGAKMTSTAWGEHYHRGKANVEHMDMLVLDIDNDPKHINTRPYLSFENAKTEFAGLASVFYTSFNHRNTYKHNVDKFRIVLPLACPVRLIDVESRKKELTKRFPFADPASFSASQPFFVSIAHPDRETLHRTWIGSGDWFDLLALEPEVKPEQSIPNVRFELTEKTFDDLPTIKLKSGVTYRADELWNVMAEGYDNRHGCYRIGEYDNKPGCFIYRHGTGLSYFDPSVGKSQFIKVYRATVAHWDEADVPTEPMWQPTPKPANDPLTRLRKSRALRGVTYDESRLVIERLNTRYLPSELVYRIPDKGITVIRSPKGTGKTELLKQVTAQCAKDARSVMLLGHRVYLLQNLAVRTNLDYYLNLAPGQTTSSMALCMNSLTRIDTKTDHPYDTLIIDESEQVFQALVSPTLHTDLTHIYNNLLWLFQKAKRIICLDADLTSDLTIEIIKEIRGEQVDDDLLGVINDYKIGEGQTTKLYEDKNHLLFDALAAIERGEKVFIATNNRKQATAIDAIVKEMGKRSLLVTAETNESEDTQTFIQDPTTECQRYDVVVTSPTLSTGVSIEGDHFDKVFGLFGMKPGTYQDADQAISRVRNCHDVSVWLQGNKTSPFVPTEEAIYDKTLNIERVALKRLFDEMVMLTQGQLLWARLYARITWIVQTWSVNKDEQFTQLRRDLGFVVVPVLKDENAASAARLIYSSFRDVGVDYASLIYNAKDLLDEDEAARLGRKKQRTYDERLMYERYRLKGTLGSEFNLENVRSALQQELHKSLGRISAILQTSDEARISSDKKDRDRNKATFTANRNRVIQNDLIADLCSKADINLEGLHADAASGHPVEIHTKTLATVAAAFAERKRDFNYYFDLRIKDPTHEMNHLKVWNATLGDWMQVPLKKKRLGPRGNQIPHYFIDLSRKGLVLKAVADAQDMRDHLTTIVKKKAV